MATPRPQVSGNHDPSLATQCLAFIQALVNESKIGFNFHLTSGQFSCSFDSNGTVTAASARIPTEVKKKSSSPSTKRRNAKRRQVFLENKKRGSSFVDCEKPAENETPQSACEKPPSPACSELPQTSALKEPTQPSSERLSFPSSSESSDSHSNNHGGGHITKKMRLEKVPPLKVLIDAQSSPKYRIQQFDGNSSLSDLALCDNDEPSELGDDTKMDQFIYCPNCDQTLTSNLHQCHAMPYADPICDSMVILGDDLYTDQCSICPYCEQTLKPNRLGYFDCDDFCVRMSYLITQDFTLELTFDPFMGPHNKKCEKEREKRKDRLESFECSTSDEDKETWRKYSSKKLCFCQNNRRIYDHLGDRF